jgi:signal transduction histidine kinase
MQGFLGITDLLSSNLEDLSKPEIKEMIESLNQSAKRQSELIEDVLTWSRLTNHNAKMEKEELNLWEEVQNVIMLLYLSAESKNISLNNSIEKDVSVYCDRNMLQLVLRNLISNAIKFSYKGSEVILYNNISEEIVEIIIEDFGVGISSANLNKLFVLGENFSLPGTDQEKGTGFGLILCKEIILNLGGNIEVESILGKGTKFIVQLPRTHKINPIN